MMSAVALCGDCSQSIVTSISRVNAIDAPGPPHAGALLGVDHLSPRSFCLYSHTGKMRPRIHRFLISVKRLSHFWVVALLNQEPIEVCAGFQILSLEVVCAVSPPSFSSFLKSRFWHYSALCQRLVKLTAPCWREP